MPCAVIILPIRFESFFPNNLKLKLIIRHIYNESRKTCNKLQYCSINTQSMVLSEPL